MRTTLKFYGAVRISRKRTRIFSRGPLLAIFLSVGAETVTLNVRPSSAMMGVRIATATPIITQLNIFICNKNNVIVIAQ